MTTATQVQLRRGTSSQVAGFTGVQGEVVVDTTNNRVVVGDGMTVGGWPMAPLARVPQILGQSHIPFVLPSSGTMGNNGALSAITALPTTYANAYLWCPANAISAGSAAGWYYTQMSSTTAGTVFNNTYTSGTLAIPGTPTPFVTTGPGAYTQTTGSNIAAYTLAIAGNAIGANGSVFIQALKTLPNTSGNKILTLNYGSYAFATQTVNSGSLSVSHVGGFSNRGVTNAQVPLSNAVATIGGNAAAAVFGAIDSTTSQNLIVYEQLATATDYLVLENIVVQLIPGVP